MAAEGSTVNSAQQVDLLQQYTSFAMHFANQSSAKAPPCERDVIRNSALIGLWKAVKNYRPVNGACFKTYARYRIRGEIYDEARAATLFGPKHGAGHYTRDLLSEEVIENLSGGGDPEAQIQQWQARQAIGRAIDGLDDGRHRQVINWYYSEGLFLHEIAEKFGVSAGRASQIKAAAIEEMSKKIEGKKMNEKIIKKGVRRG